MKLRQILEVAVRPNDPEMAGMYPGKELPGSTQHEGPYAVGWSSQSHEWYGSDEGPENGDGRYKPKGDGGEIVAINVPEHALAQQIANKLDADYKAKKFYDQTVYHTMGEDWYVNNYRGAWVRPMDELEEWDFIPPKTKDYSK